MSAFLTACILRVKDDSDYPTTWILEDELHYASDLLGSTVVVPRLYVTDLASIPETVNVRLVGHRAAIVHDWLISSHSVPRETADCVFDEALRVCRCSDFDRCIYVEAVKMYTRSLHPNLAGDMTGQSG